jgi:hypothetical protein
MLEAVITFLITVCVIALVVYLIIWVLGIVGIVLPPKVIQILWVIFTLIVILFLVKLVLGGGGLSLGSLGGSHRSELEPSYASATLMEPYRVEIPYKIT